jgi:hypothetical protein
VHSLDAIAIIGFCMPEAEPFPLLLTVRDIFGDCVVESKPAALQVQSVKIPRAPRHIGPLRRQQVHFMPMRSGREPFHMRKLR